jgi:hypothetical protein
MEQRPLLYLKLLKLYSANLTNLSYLAFASRSALANNSAAFSGLERASEL